MKTILFLSIFLLSISSNRLFAQENKKANSVGIGIAVIPPFPEGMYFGHPWDFHPNRELSYFIQGNFQRMVFTTFKTGIFVDFERVRFTVEDFDTVKSFRRYNAGIDFLYCFPDKSLHMEIGGFLGGGLLKANHWDNLSGFDYGFIVGPAWERNRIGLSAQFRSGFANYTSNGIPSAVRLYTPKVAFRMYFRF